nr:MAG TPA: hypothetical protein [Caudoviricetes sp.]
MQSQTFSVKSGAITQKSGENLCTTKKCSIFVLS